jgi:hypothetical protein
MDAYSHPEDRRVRVTIEASDYTCEGLVHLPGIRLSDVLNEKSPFLVVVKAVMLNKKLGSAEQRPMEVDTVFINKRDVKYLVPMDEELMSRY